MNLDYIVDKLKAATQEVEWCRKYQGTQERLALTGRLAIEALQADPEHTSPREVVDMITQSRPGCHMLSKGDACDCGLCEREAEIHRLTDMIGKLPKCWRLTDDGKLVQDELVLPGMVLWYHGMEMNERVEVVSLDNIESPWPATVLKEQFGKDLPITIRWAVCNCYSTREAAEAARNRDSS